MITRESQRVFVAGHRGMVGSAILRLLRKAGSAEIVTRSHQELDLTRQIEVESFFQSEKIDTVYLAAAKVGGIYANNTYPAQFLYENLIIESNIIHAAHQCGVQRLLLLGSSCIYPKMARQPISEESLLTGALEPTNEPYAVAKIAGIKLCESYNRQYGRDYRSLMPTNLYGPGDNFHPEHSHVVAGLIRRFDEANRNGARSVVVWGTGRPQREFMHVDDLAEACTHTMSLSKLDYREYTEEQRSHLNVGVGVDCSIAELAHQIAEVVGFHGRIEFDTSKPDGAPRKLLDVSRINATGWGSKISLSDGLRATYKWYVENRNDFRNV